MAARATSRAIVAGAIRRTLLVFFVDNPRRHEHVRGSMDHAADLACERDEQGSKQRDEESAPTVHVELAYAIPVRRQPLRISRHSPLR
jgi:hypothetical protein